MATTETTIAERVKARRERQTKVESGASQPSSTEKTLSVEPKSDPPDAGDSSDDGYILFNL